LALVDDSVVASDAAAVAKLRPAVGLPPPSFVLDLEEPDCGRGARGVPCAGRVDNAVTAGGLDVADWGRLCVDLLGLAAVELLDFAVVDGAGRRLVGDVTRLDLVVAVVVVEVLVGEVCDWTPADVVRPAAPGAG